MNKLKPKVIGLTGGVASGKTTVLNEFRKAKFIVISSDRISRETFYKKNIGRKIKNLFGTLSRDKIRKIIFSNVEKRHKLEKILHPEIIKTLKSQILNLKSKCPAIVVDVPLLFEVHLEKMFDKTIVVYCKKNQQLTRLMKRDKITKKQAKGMIRSQMPLSKKVKLADFVVKNTGQKNKIKHIVKKLLDKIK